MNENQREALYTQGWHLQQLDLSDENVRSAFDINRQLLGLAGSEPEEPEEETPEPVGDFSIENDRLSPSIDEPVSGGSAMPTRRCLVIHFTAGASAKSSIEYWRSSRAASAHLVIDRDGTVYQCRPFNRTAGHAGKSRWRDPKTGTLYSGLNSCSIGIELANGGSSYPSKFSKLEPIEAKHKNGGPLIPWEVYTDEQIAATLQISKLLVDTYNLDDVVGHEDIAPERKTDPGPAFPMERLREFCGFKGLPVVHRL